MTNSSPTARSLVNPSSQTDFGPSLLVTGHAGTGKTTRLLEILQERLNRARLADHQTIPVISAMHGARRRLVGKLAEIQRARNSEVSPFRFRVETIDSFALHVANRGRSFLGERRPIVPCDILPSDDERVLWIEVGNCCEWATRVLQHPQAKVMLRDSYPLVVIDEFQDCHGATLEFVQQLAQVIPIVAAADEFQVISGDGDDTHAVKWAASTFRVEDLGEDNKSHRAAKNPCIRNTAAALRSGQQTARQARVKVVCEPKGPLAGSLVARVVKSLGRDATIALIAYSFKNHFSARALDLLNNGSKNWQETGKGLAPVPFTLLASQQSELEKHREIVKNTFRNEKCYLGQNLPSALLPDVAEAWRTCQYQARRLGRDSWSRTHLQNEVSGRVHKRHSFSPATSRRTALTISSAKNQEWDYVFILWAKEFFRDSHTENHRIRLLYNAITRAKRDCVVIVRAKNWKEALADHPYLDRALDYVPSKELVLE